MFICSPFGLMYILFLIKMKRFNATARWLEHFVKNFGKGGGRVKKRWGRKKRVAVVPHRRVWGGGRPRIDGECLSLRHDYQRVSHLYSQDGQTLPACSLEKMLGVFVRAAVSLIRFTCCCCCSSSCCCHCCLFSFITNPSVWRCQADWRGWGAARDHSTGFFFGFIIINSKIKWKIK